MCSPFSLALTPFKCSEHVPQEGEKRKAKGQKLDLLTVRGAEMENQLRVTLEIGPKGKKVVAVAQNWNVN